MSFARLCLVGVSSLVLMAAGTPPPGPQPPEDYKVLAHDLLRDIIAVHSVHAEGTKGVADIIVKYLKAGGFTDSEITEVADPHYPNQMNVVVRLKGNGKARPVLWNGHMDVVEAKAADWTKPPFTMTEEDGWLYGRGSTDMKDADAAMAVSLIRLRKEGYQGERDIIVALSADEEVGLEQDGMDYLAQHRRDLVDAEFAMDPDGGSGEYKDGRRLDFNVETGEKTYVTYLLQTSNPGGHSSEPRPDNAIYELASALTKLAAYQFPYKTNASTRAYFKGLAEDATGERKADLLTLSHDGSVDEAAAKRLATDTSLNAILHSTCVATMLSAGHQENALAGSATATVQCRIYPDETVEGTAATLAQVIGDPGVAISHPDKVVSAPETVPDAGVMTLVTGVVDGMWPGVKVMPSMAAGASDMIYMRGAGIPAYGVGGGWNDVDDMRQHGRDERHEAADFYSSVEFTYRLMKALTSKPTP